MTFLYDEIIIEELKKALEPKIAQVAPVFNPRQMQNVALKLLDNIRTTLAPSEITIATNAQLFSKNMINLESILNWLENNLVRYQGKPIVVADKNHMDATVKYEVYNVAPAPNKYVWKDGLIGFLKDLQNQAKTSGNVFFVQQVNGLISDANSKLQTNIEDTAETTTEEKKNNKTETSNKTTENQTSNNTNQQNQNNNQINQEQNQNQNVSTTDQQSQQIQVAVKNTQQAMQQAGFGTISLPFDVDTDQLLIRDIEIFKDQITAGLRTALDSNSSLFGIMYTQLQQVSRSITNWDAVASPAAKEGGFQLNSNTDIDAWVNTYAPNGFPEARSMLNNIVPLIQNTSNLLTSLLRIPVFVSLYTDEALKNQISRGREMISYTQHMISKIEDAIRAGNRR